MAPPSTPRRVPIVIGWREWVRLVSLELPPIKAKIDTGARSSSLHAIELEIFERGETPWVRFKVHPLQRDARLTLAAEAEVAGYRTVRSSSGHLSRRPVIVTEVELLGRRWPIELTLANRDEMGFRMLLGRQAVRRRCLVDPGRSFLCGQPDRNKKRRREKI